MTPIQWNAIGLHLTYFLLISLARRNDLSLARLFQNELNYTPSPTLIKKNN